MRRSRWKVALTGGPLDGVVMEREAKRPDDVGYAWVQFDGRLQATRFVSYVFTGEVRRLRTVFARFDRETVRKIVP